MALGAIANHGERFVPERGNFGLFLRIDFRGHGLTYWW